MADFILYTKPGCVYCNRAKALLEKRGLGFRERVIGHDVDRDWVIMTFPGMKTVPIIQSVDNAFLGGYEELVAHLATEQKDTMDV